MISVYRMTIAVILALSAAGLRAEDTAAWPAGDWKGTLQAGQQKLEVVYQMQAVADGEWTGGMDVPAQGAVGLLQSIEVSGTSIRIAMPLPGHASYQEQWRAAEQRMDGSFDQAAQSSPLVLKRMQGEVARPVCPQKPSAPLPYRSEAVRFPNAGMALNGTLIRPDQKGYFPGIVELLEADRLEISLY